jgi:hypothetical protein
MFTRGAIALLLASFLSVPSAWAITGLSVAVDGFGGYTQTTVPTGATKPTILTFGGGVHVGMPLGPLTAGITSDFKMYNQYSDPDQVVGNQRGNRWNMVAPYVAMDFGSLTARVNVQFLGSYKLGNKTADGADLSYTKPFGGRADVLYGMGPKIKLGAYFEYLMFGNQNSTTTGDTVLTTKWKLTQFGLLLSFAVL